MCEFDYMYLKERSWDGEFLSLVAQIRELCPSIRSSSVEAALKRLKDEGYIRSQGRGRSTAYVRDPII